MADAYMATTDMAASNQVVVFYYFCKRMRL
uniref:Uncharacterized protein n=1 Tax=Arundo donax TaxID=35708 RepID=A0A0A9EDE9_ARUDO